MARFCWSASSAASGRLRTLPGPRGRGAVEPGHVPAKELGFDREFAGKASSPGSGGSVQDRRGGTAGVDEFPAQFRERVLAPDQGTESAKDIHSGAARPRGSACSQFRELPCGRDAVIRVGREQLENDGLEPRWHVTRAQREHGGRASPLNGQDFCRVAARERRAPREHAVQGGSDRVVVRRARIGGLVEHLRRDVAGSAADAFAGGIAEATGEAEVEDLGRRRALGIRHHAQVRGVEVAVDEPGGMKRVESGQGVPHRVQGSSQVARPHRLVEGLPLEELHREVGAPVGEDPEVEDADDADDSDSVDDIEEDLES